MISDYEGFSNVISEALSTGLPVITSNIPENSYLIKDQENGYVVNHRDPLAIANGINEYLELSYEKKKEMSFRNRRKAEDLFDKEKIYNQYLQIINSLEIE